MNSKNSRPRVPAESKVLEEIHQLRSQDPSVSNSEIRRQLQYQGWDISVKRLGKIVATTRPTSQPKKTGKSQYRMTIEKLPDELLLEILEYAIPFEEPIYDDDDLEWQDVRDQYLSNTTTLHALCATSRRFRNLAQPLLFRDFSFTIGVQRRRQFLRTILRKSELASHIQTVALWKDPGFSTALKFNRQDLKLFATAAAAVTGLNFKTCQKKLTSRGVWIEALLIVSHAPKLKNLYLYDDHGVSPEFLNLFSPLLNTPIQRSRINGFQSLREVYLSLEYDSDDKSLMPLLELPSLRRLEIERMDDYDWPDEWLHRQYNTQSSIKVLNLWHTRLDEGRFKLILSRVRSLENLHYDLSDEAVVNLAEISESLIPHRQSLKSFGFTSYKHSWEDLDVDHYLEQPALSTFQSFPRLTELCLPDIAFPESCDLREFLPPTLECLEIDGQLKEKDMADMLLRFAEHCKEHCPKLETITFFRGPEVWRGNAENTSTLLAEVIKAFERVGVIFEEDFSHSSLDDEEMDAAGWDDMEGSDVDEDMFHEYLHYLDEGWHPDHGHMYNGMGFEYNFISSDSE